MKKIISLAMVLITVLSVADFALAGDNVTLSISCTIPAIPGINAPPLLVKQGLQQAPGAEDPQQTQEAGYKESETQQKAETLFIAQELPGNIQILYSR